MQQFVEQGTLAGAQKEGGGSAEGSVPMSPHAAVVVRPCRAQPPAPPYPSYPACWGTRLNPAPREDAALQVWDCEDSGGLPLGLGEMCPCLQEVVAGSGSVSPGGGAAGGGQQPVQHQGWHRGDRPPSEVHLL